MTSVKGKKILVLGGNPRETVDSFRFYANYTHTAQEALEAATQLAREGALVTLVAPQAAKLTSRRAGLTIVDTCHGKPIVSAKDMLNACQSLPACDDILQLASAASITCPAPAGRKLQKSDAQDKAALFTVAGNVDVLEALRRRFPGTPIAGYDNHQHWHAHGNTDWIPVAGKRDVAEAPRDKPHTGAYTGPLAGRHVVVTAGRTEEQLTYTGDVITNAFTGRQGHAVACALAQAGARVTLISGLSDLPPPGTAAIRTLPVRSAREMHEAAEAVLKRGAVDAFIGVAAVADFGLPHPMTLDLAENDRRVLPLEENPSIVGLAAGHANRPKVVVSFAAQSEETIREYALAKFHKLGVDLTVANPIGEDTPAAKNPDDTRIMLVDGDGVGEPMEMKKDAVGKLLAGKVAELLNAKETAREGVIR